MSALVFLFASSVALFAQDRPLIIGGDSNYPPYEFLDRLGRPTGYNVDLSRAIARVMGLNVEIRLGAWGEVRDALMSGEIDLIHGMFYSEERAKAFDFSPHHTIINHGVFVRSADADIREAEDLRGKALLVMRGDIMHDYALERGYGETVETTQSQADALRALAAGQGDCVLSAVLPARYWIRELRLSNLRQTGPILVSYRYCYASKKGNAEILSQFSEGLAILRQTGEYQEIYDKWLGALEPRGFSRKTVLLTLLAVLVPLVIVTGLIVAWSWSLRSLVRARTMELEYALDLQRKSEEERLRLQGRIQQAQKHESLTRVTGGVAHHFNNIMHVISGNSQMILEETPPDSLPHTLAQEILNSAQRAIDISSQMGLFAGRDGERFEEVDLGGLIKEMEPLLRAGTASHHEFRAETAGRIPRVKGDPAQIRQALTNLATNADEALGKVKDGRIILRAGNLLIEERARLDGYWAEKPKPGRYAFVEVEDNGAGIESDALERVFDPFFSTKFPGRGLGLAAVLGVVRGLHGGVRVESRIGKGTRVQLLFPVEEKGSGVSS